MTYADPEFERLLLKVYGCDAMFRVITVDDLR